MADRSNISHGIKTRREHNDDWTLPVKWLLTSDRGQDIIIFRILLFSRYTRE